MSDVASQSFVFVAIGSGQLSSKELKDKWSEGVFLLSSRLHQRAAKMDKSKSFALLAEGNFPKGSKHSLSGNRTEKSKVATGQLSTEGETGKGDFWLFECRVCV
jgi:hypothetical protein